MEVKRFNRKFMKNTFRSKSNSKMRPSDLIVNGRKTTQSGDRQNPNSSPPKKLTYLPTKKKF